MKMAFKHGLYGILTALKNNTGKMRMHSAVTGHNGIHLGISHASTTSALSSHRH